MEEHLYPLPEVHIVVDADGWKGDQVSLPCPLEVPKTSHGDPQNINILLCLQLKNGKQQLFFVNLNFQHQYYYLYICICLFGWFCF